jgi:GDP-4-dehydro-6-deoxy-D-mannose reductase
MTAPAPQRILVTGASGFVGGRLVAQLRQQMPDAELILADRAAGADGSHALDISDAAAVEQFVADSRPTTIVHLAAISAVPNSFSDPRQTWNVNTLGTLNVVTAMRRHAPACHLLFVSSAEVYGRSTFSGAPVTETTLLQPANPYAVTKAAADLMVQDECGRGLKATIIRPFNHTGPGQAPNFAVPSFCSQIAAIEKGRQPPVVEVGDLDDERDFLDVDDVIDLYVSVIARGGELAAGLVLNAASGQPRRIGGLLDMLRAMSPAEFTVSVDPKRQRITRVPRVVGDASRARELLGWTPKKPMEATLRETLDYWRSLP